MKIEKEKMFIEFKLLGKRALAMNHYDLESASPSEFTVEEWKQFLMEPDVIEYIKKEMEIIRSTQVNKIVQDSTSTKSVAQAQLLKSLNDLGDNGKTADGPVFIYCYVPLNDEQKFASNIQEVDENGKAVETISKE